jgi:hypothetical protein
MKKYFIATLFSLCSLSSVYAQEHGLADPAGKVILSVATDAAISETEQKRIEFDKEMLMDLEQFTIKTKTPWTESEDVYKGPLLRSLLEKLGIKSESITISALNDYKAILPVSDAYEYDVILATEVNGKAMSIRDKGPIFILYPFDQNPSLKNEVIYNRSVWQANKIDAN